MEKSPRSSARAFGFGLAGVALAVALIPPPSAEADKGSFAEAVGCSVTTMGLVNLAKAVTAEFGALTNAVLTAAIGYECPKLWDKWVNNQPGTLQVRTPTRTVSESLSPSQLVTRLPVKTIWETREQQCSGWTIGEYYDMCVHGELDPIYY